jgi:endonuclease/exonuclease/phosphatase family metal-dependent hydrolase
VRVVTFNIEFAKHVDRAITVLRDTPALQHPDLLVLQEMDPEGVRQIAEAFDLNALYAPGGVHPTPRHDFGVALLSPWPLVDRRKILLPHTSRGTHLQKAVVGATLVMGDRRLRVYGVHLPSPLAVSGSDRKEQVATVLADARDATDPVVIAGDLNSHGIGEEFERAGYLWLTSHVGVSTVEMGALRLSYDHVFVKPARQAPP